MSTAVVRYAQTFPPPTKAQVADAYAEILALQKPGIEYETDWLTDDRTGLIFLKFGEKWELAMLSAPADREVRKADPDRIVFSGLVDADEDDFPELDKRLRAELEECKADKQ